MTLEACLPESLRVPSTRITRITRGLSGAGVYRVEAGEQRYVLKISADSDPIETWRSRIAIQLRAADARVAPRVAHHDEARRAVVSELAVARGFPSVEQLGHTLGRLHAIPLPEGAVLTDPRATFSAVWAGLAGLEVPTFARTAIDQAFAEAPPPSDRPRVTSHNDPNPSNFVFDGERLLLLDWDAAGPNDPFYDLAAVAMFLRLDDVAAARLVAAHDGATPTELPARFHYARRLVAASCSTMAFQLAHRGGYSGRPVRTEDAPTLASVYVGLSSGTLDLGAPEGLWAFALALAKALEVSR